MVPDPVWVGSKWLLAFVRVPVTLGTLLAPTFFSLCCNLNDCRRAAHSFFKIGHLSSPFSCLSLACLHILILLLLLISGNIHPNPGPIFSYSRLAGNVTWEGRSVQCCTCSKWVHLRCSLLSSKFTTLGSSHYRSCHTCCIPASSGDNTVTFSLNSSSLYTSTVQFNCPTLAFKPFIPFYKLIFPFSTVTDFCERTLLKAFQHLSFCHFCSSF